MARGDVFKKPFYIKLLTRLKILPVYRTSEGVENLETNYTTFDQCKEIFSRNGIVLMFSEGKCINEWHLRPLKKGTARLAISSWQGGIDVKVLPVGINYSSFRKFGKNVMVSFGNIIAKEEILSNETDGKRNLAFNDTLRNELEKMVFEIPATDTEKKKKLLFVNVGIAGKILLAIPALTGLLLNAPLYLPIRQFANARTKDTDHYDSVITALLIITYPFYILLLSLCIYFLTHSFFSFLLVPLLPFTAWSYVQLKKQLD